MSIQFGADEVHNENIAGLRVKRFHIIRAWLARWWSNVAVRVAVGAIVSVVFLALALRAVPADQVWGLLAQANLAFVGLTLASIVVNTIAKALRWKVLLGADGRAIHMWDLLGALLIGQMLNTFIPTRIGDLSRAYAIGQRGPGMAFVLGTIVVEKLLDMIAFGLIVLGLLLFVPLPEWAAGPAYRVLVVGALVVVGIVSCSRGRLVSQVFAWTQRRFRHPFATKVFAAFHAAFQSGSVLGGLRDRSVRDAEIRHGRSARLLRRRYPLAQALRLLRPRRPDPVGRRRRRVIGR